MSKLLIEQSTLIEIGDAVRGCDGTSEPIPVIDLADRINAHVAEIIGLLDEINGDGE